MKEREREREREIERERQTDRESERVTRQRKGVLLKKTKKGWQRLKKDRR